jgi:hypothetical protein
MKMAEMERQWDRYDKAIENDRHNKAMEEY